MSQYRDIRPARPEDTEAILALYPRAFPDEDLTGLVAELLGHEAVLNLVAWQGDTLVGHGAFTRCELDDHTARAGLLGPLCVDPDAQRSGLGKALIDAGAKALAEEGLAELLVLGDPAYYGRLGFDRPAAIKAPYPLPSEWAEAWRSVRLSDAPVIDGARLRAPEPWQDKALWG